MRVLVACEFSGTVRDAFIEEGHDAVSCDLLPTESPGPHIQGDVLEVLDQGWDMMIAHPPCTYLSSSGMHWTTRGLRDPQLTEDALEFVHKLLEANIPRIALENPVGVISTRIRKPDQIIQPWQFGHDASKATCLWLKGLPRLQHTAIIPPRGWFRPLPLFPYDHTVKRGGYTFVKNGKYVKPVWGNQTPSGQNKLGPSDKRWADRSETYRNIASAMARQWG